MDTTMLNENTQKVLSIFEEISQVPRGSYHTDRIAAYLVKWAEDRNLSVQRDAYNNVLIRKPASPGKENETAVMLQGHMDMVCQKTPESTHDFEKDPIEIVQKQNYLYANGTTLGADNGIGMSLIMAVLDDPNAVHPPIEALITADEEVGMIGAKHLSESGWEIRAKTLINLDSGWEGEFIVGCASGCTAELKLPVSRAANDDPCFRISISGLLGGHSGAEIHLGHGHAIEMMGRLLSNLHTDYRLVSLSGGGMNNVISREATAVVACSQGEALAAEVEQWADIFRRELKKVDPGFVLRLTPCEAHSEALDAASTCKVARMLLLLPCGPLKSDYSLGVVITSNNLGVVELTDDVCRVVCSMRSNMDTQVSHRFLPILRAIAQLLGAEITEFDSYPGWEYEPESHVRPLAMQIYEEITGRPARFRVLHAGLECGILMDQCGTMDAISYGPEINFPHSPRENVNMESVMTAERLVRELLQRI